LNEVILFEEFGGLRGRVSEILRFRCKWEGRRGRHETPEGRCVLELSVWGLGVLRNVVQMWIQCSALKETSQRVNNSWPSN